MSPRLPSAIASKPASWAYSTTLSKAAHPGAPSCSKRASCGLTATQAGPAASIKAMQCTSTAFAADSAGDPLPPLGASPSALDAPPPPLGAPPCDATEAALRFEGHRPQRHRVGVEPEHDLGLALGHACREQVSETGDRCGRGRGLGHHRGEYACVTPLTRFSWIATVVVALVTALLLLLSDYTGYAALSVAVACSAAINLL